MELAPDGLRLVSAGADGRVIVWQSEPFPQGPTGAPSAEPRDEEPQPIVDRQISFDTSEATITATLMGSGRDFGYLCGDDHQKTRQLERKLTRGRDGKTDFDGIQERIKEFLGGIKYVRPEGSTATDVLVRICIDGVESVDGEVGNGSFLNDCRDVPLSAGSESAEPVAE